MLMVHMKPCDIYLTHKFVKPLLISHRLVGIIHSAVADEQIMATIKITLPFFIISISLLSNNSNGDFVWDLNEAYRKLSFS